MPEPDPRLGRVTLDPAGPVVAGSMGQWTLTITVGSYGIDEGGTIKIAQRFASDFQPPQFDRPRDAGYTTIATSGEARLVPHYDRKSHIRPWMKCLVLDVVDGSLAPGDTVTIVMGDRRQGSPGMRAQTFIESDHAFRVLIDPTNACLVRPLPDSPTFPVISGEPVRLVCIVPTQAVVGRPVEIFVKGEDCWGNPTPAPGPMQRQWIGEGSPRMDGGQITFDSPTTGRVGVTCGELSCESNPITAHLAEPALKRYWGDLHAQTDATVGTGTEEQYFTFGRDIARLDFTSHQGNDFQMTDEDWRRLNDTVRRFHQDGRYVVFPGYEWSANTPAGGDRNVFYREEGLPIIRSSHWQIPQVAEDERTPAHPADVFFQRMRQHVPIEKVLLGSHVGGRWADMRRYFDNELGPLVEVVSCWGVFEWMLWDAIEKDYVIGVMCNSDGHKGRPGAEGPGAGDFGIAGGLTCVLARELSRAAVWEALRNRRCYGTTGARIDLDFSFEGQPMGSVIDSRGGILSASVHGAGPLESLSLYHGKQMVAQVRGPEFEAAHDSPRVRVVWQGSRIRGRGRRVNWEGRVQLDHAIIRSAATYSFDSAADGITGQDEREVRFRSQTTGDRDGLDLALDRAREGSLRLDTQAGSARVDLRDLDAAPRVFDFGGVDMQVTVQRYPPLPQTTSLWLEHAITPPQRRTPYWIKAIQCDGQMAWSSPIYLKKSP